MSAQRMSRDQIRMLLGGYATNTLTETERSALFEAALDDQELFDALHQEQALKNVLADPVARAEVRQTLDRPAPQRSPWWIWGGAIGTVAATAVLVAVFWPHSVSVLEKPVEIAAEKSAPQPSPPAPAQSHVQTTAPRAGALPQPARRPQPTAPAAPTPQDTVAPAPAPVIPPPVVSQTTARASDTAALSQEARGGVGGARPASGARTANGFTELSRTSGLLAPSTLRYSLVQMDPGTREVAPISPASLKPGDQVRLQVSTTLAGRIVLTSVDSSGASKSIASVAAAANASYVLPDAPISVTNGAQQFRLTFEPSAPQAKAAASRAQLAAPSVPPPIEITIVAGAR
jgi:hypothetical protein